MMTFKCLKIDGHLCRNGAVHYRCLESCNDTWWGWAPSAGQVPTHRSPAPHTLCRPNSKGKTLRLQDGMKWTLKIDDYNIHSLHVASSKKFSGKTLWSFIFHVKGQPLPAFLPLTVSLFLKPKGSLLFTKQFRPCSHFSLVMFKMLLGNSPTIQKFQIYPWAFIILQGYRNFPWKLFEFEQNFCLSCLL